jgi:predicted transcriptional regulator
VIEIDFNKILLERIKEDFQEEKKKVVEHLEELKSLLIRIAKAGRWTLTTTAMGMETHHPEQKRYLDLLEGCGLIESKIKYTKHNEYREYSVTEKGQALVRQFFSDA